MVFTLDKPSVLFLATMARTDCGSAGIYHRSSLGPDGKWLEPVGTGPFKFAGWKRGESLDLVRFDHYAALPGKPDGLTGNKTALVPPAALRRHSGSGGGKDRGHGGGHRRDLARGPVRTCPTIRRAAISWSTARRP